MMQHRHTLDLAVWFSTGVAAVSWANAAFSVTIIAGLISILLGLIKLRDRVKYGPPRYSDD